MTIVTRTIATVLAAVFLAGLAGCSSGSTTGSQVATTAPAAPDMRDARYCEVLLVTIVDSQPVASVYNSYPLNDCPSEKWSALDPKALASANGSTIALLNGPRHWMIDRVEKVGSATFEKVDFGGIEMYKQATVPIGSLIDQVRPYSPYPVSRSTIFTYLAGTEIFELVGPDGSTYVMQSFSQQKDPSLTLATLGSLGSRLSLPAGWRFATRVLQTDLDIVTVENPAQVLQDDFGNSYSMVPANPED